MVDDVGKIDNHQMSMIMNDNIDEFHIELIFVVGLVLD
jgi:hypothetical protein